MEVSQGGGVGLRGGEEQARGPSEEQDLVCLKIEKKGHIWNFQMEEKGSE